MSGLGSLCDCGGKIASFQHGNSNATAVDLKIFAPAARLIIPSFILIRKYIRVYSGWGHLGKGNIDGF